MFNEGNIHSAKRSNVTEHVLVLQQVNLDLGEVALLTLVLDYCISALLSL